LIAQSTYCTRNCEWESQRCTGFQNLSATTQWTRCYRRHRLDLRWLTRGCHDNARQTETTT
jgi:hypothetical protein